MKKRYVHLAILAILLFWGCQCGDVRGQQLLQVIDTNLKRAQGWLDRNPRIAQETAQDMYQRSQIEGYVKGEIKSLRIWGRACSRQDNLKQAVSMLKKSLKLAQKDGEEEEVAKTQLHLMNVYRKLEEYDTALIIGKKALQYFELNESKTLTIETLDGIARVYSDQGNLNLALLINKRVLGQSLQQRDTFLMAASYNDLGELYIQQKEYRWAEQKLQQAKQLYEAKNSRQGILDVILNQVTLFLAEQKNEQAFAALESIRTLKILHYSPIGRSRIFDQYAEVFRRQGNYAEALRYFELAQAIRDSLNYAEQRRQVQELEVHYQARNKEEQVRRLLAEQKMHEEENTQKGYLLAVMVFLLVFMSATALIFLQNSRRRSRLNAELRQRKEEIERQNEQLYDLNAEKDGLISIVAHDLKAPLNKVDGFAQLIPLVGDMNNEQASYLEKINRATTNGRRLIRDLLDILTTENMGSSTEASQFILSKVVKLSLEGFVERAKQKNIKLAYHYDHDDELVVTDRSFLERILDNLVSNAIKFSERNTQIEVRTTLDKEIFCLEVHDQGPGISQEDQKMMFRKFQRLSAKPTGGEASTGLGLSIIKALVERLHGRIEVDSTLGEGTRFSVFLPRELKQ